MMMVVVILRFLKFVLHAYDTRPSHIMMKYPDGSMEGRNLLASWYLNIIVGMTMLWIDDDYVMLGQAMMIDCC